ncbi:hypothetical protein HMPREF3291_00445 [Bacillus sp. HMSC76G11]|nr:hypothetical protein HMPREF3291_00445 [Bacillus sp. HMSC76G11]
MARSIRFVRRGITQGKWRQNFNWPGVITAKSVVHVTVGEVKFGTTQNIQTEPRQNFHYILEEAAVWITNIGPHKNEFTNDPGGVEFFIHSSFRGPIDVAITISVEDNLPVEIQGY